MLGMNRLSLIALLVLVAAPVAADPLLRVTPNAYGMGMGMDQYGRAIPHDPHQRVTPNAYGLGVGMDQYGRPVRYGATGNGQVSVGRGSVHQGCTNLQAKVFPVRCGVMTAEEKAQLKADKKAAKAQAKAERKAAKQARKAATTAG